MGNDVLHTHTESQTEANTSHDTHSLNKTYSSHKITEDKTNQAPLVDRDHNMSTSNKIPIDHEEAINIENKIKRERKIHINLDNTNENNKKYQDESMNQDDSTQSVDIQESIISSTIASSTANPESMLNDTISSHSDHNRNDTNTIDESNECAIISNIQSTNGDSESNEDEYEETDTSTEFVNTNDCIRQGEESMSEGVDDEGFGSNTDSNNGDWGDFNEDTYDGQDYIEMKAATPPSEAEPGVEDDLLANTASTDTGKCSRLRPVVAEAGCRTWICEYCHAFNNLMDSMKRNYECIVCAGKYRPGQALIESKEQDKAPAPKQPSDEKTSTVWYCTNCSNLNLINSDFCGSCNKTIPSEKLITFTSSESVKPSISISKVQVGFRKTEQDIMKAIGAAKLPNEYPLNSDFSAIMYEAFGAPYKMSLCGNYCWPKHRINGMMKIPENLDPLWAKSIAINQKTGYIAIIQAENILVLRPKGATGYTVAARGDHKIRFKVIYHTRIRFVGDKIYVFDDGAVKKFLYFRFDEKKGKIYFLNWIFDGYFNKVMIRDFVLTEELFIVLFNNWLGIYKLSPAVTWYHAVAYSAYDGVRPTALEMCVYDDVEDKEKDLKAIDRKQSIKNYVYILCNNNIISLHPTNATFEYLHHVTNVGNDVSFCSSKTYGTFWIDKYNVWQSPVCDKRITKRVCCVSDVQTCNETSLNWFTMGLFGGNNRDITNKDIKQFYSVHYDEGYGISGRLLINCCVGYGMKEMSVFYQLFNEDELMPLKNELEAIEYRFKKYLWRNEKEFNVVVLVFEMLYGSDLIQMIEN